MRRIGAEESLPYVPAYHIGDRVDLISGLRVWVTDIAKEYDKEDPIAPEYSVYQIWDGYMVYSKVVDWQILGKAVPGEE